MSRSRAFSLADIETIRAHAPQGVSAIRRALDGRFSVRGIRYKAKRVGIQIVEPSTAVGQCKDRRGLASSVATFNPSFGGKLKPDSAGAKKGVGLLVHFERDSAAGLVTLLDRRPDQCAWPYNTPAGMRYCGAPVARGAYCADCYARGHAETHRDDAA